MICDKCNGTGLSLKCSGILCDKCKGRKDIDWVDNIVGANKKDIFEDLIGILKDTTLRSNNRSLDEK